MNTKHLLCTHQTLKRAKLQKMLLNPLEVQKMMVFVKSTIASAPPSLRIQKHWRSFSMNAAEALLRQHIRWPRKSSIEINCTCKVIDSAEGVAASPSVKSSSLFYIRAAVTLLLSGSLLFALTDYTENYIAQFSSSSSQEDLRIQAENIAVSIYITDFVSGDTNIRQLLYTFFCSNRGDNC